MKMVAWAPQETVRVVRLSAIWVAPTQVLDWDIYLSLLADRIQNLINKTWDPEQAMFWLQKDLSEAGLYSDFLTTPIEEAANWMVWSAPGVGSRLSSLVTFPRWGFKPMPVQAARRQLNLELQSPEDALTSWSSAITRLW